MSLDPGETRQGARGALLGNCSNIRAAVLAAAHSVPMLHTTSAGCLWVLNRFHITKY